MAKEQSASDSTNRRPVKTAVEKKSTPPPTAPKTMAATIGVDGGEVQLTVGEVNILAVFKKYLMTPGRMLCLNNTEIGTMKRSLDKLIAAGLLTPEDFKGSYSLTRSGFNVMNELI
jgi:hypothetical protein